jgi:hypothetical protein
MPDVAPDTIKMRRAKCKMHDIMPVVTEFQQHLHVEKRNETIRIEHKIGRNSE